MAESSKAVSSPVHEKDAQVIRHYLKITFGSSHVPFFDDLRWIIGPEVITLAVGSLNGVDVHARWDRTLFDKHIIFDYIRQDTHTTVQNGELYEVDYLESFKSIMAHENALKTKVDIMRGFTKGCLILKSLTPPSSAHITNAQLNYMRRAICRITQPYRHARERGSRDVTDEFDSVGEFILVEYREDDPRDNGFIAINAKPMAGDEVALNDPSESRGDADGTATINSTGRSTVLAVPPPPTACAKSHGDLAPRPSDAGPFIADPSNAGAQSADSSKVSPSSLGLSSTAKVPEVSPEGAAEVDLITEFEKQYTRKEKAKTMLQVGNPQLGREDKEYEGMQKEYEEMRETMKELQNRMNAKRATRKSIRHSIKVAEEEMAQAEARMQDVTSKMKGAQGIAIGKKLGVLERRSRKRQHSRSLDADPVPYEGQPQKVVRTGKPRQREIANEDDEPNQH